MGDGVRCSFCGKPDTETGKVVEGDGGAFICAGCVAVCVEELEVRGGLGNASELRALRFDIAFALRRIGDGFHEAAERLSSAKPHG